MDLLLLTLQLVVDAALLVLAFCDTATGLLTRRFGAGRQRVVF